MYNGSKDLVIYKKSLLIIYKGLYALFIICTQKQFSIGDIRLKYKCVQDFTYKRKSIYIICICNALGLILIVTLGKKIVSISSSCKFHDLYFFVFCFCILCHQLTARHILRTKYVVNNQINLQLLLGYLLYEVPLQRHGTWSSAVAGTSPSRSNSWKWVCPHMMTPKLDSVFLGSSYIGFIPLK